MTPLRMLLLASAAGALAAGAHAQGSPPVCDNGGPYHVEAQGAQTVIQLDGSLSFDPDGTPLTYFWRDECPQTSIQNQTTAMPTMTVNHGGGAGACSYVCNFHAELQLSSGGGSSKCRFVVSVQDTTAPILSLPPDLTAVWGIDEDPSNTGFATAVDVADPDPVITWSEVRVPAVLCSGFEEYIHRTWVATDACGNQDTGLQIISLLSPSGGCSGGGTSNLELDPESCQNTIDPQALRGLFSTELMGRKGFDVAQVDVSTVRLIRADRAGPHVYPVRQNYAPIGDWMRATSLIPAQCSTYGVDGQDDMTLVFSRRQVIKYLGLDQLPVGTTVPLAVTGKFHGGQAFWQADQIVVQ